MASQNTHDAKVVMGVGEGVDGTQILSSGLLFRSMRNHPLRQCTVPTSCRRADTMDMSIDNTTPNPARICERIWSGVQRRRGIGRGWKEAI
jgi:hypothetical protein